MDNVDHNGYFWVPTLFNLWSRVANSSNQDMLFLDIFGRLAKEQVCDPFSIGWGEREISYIFARGARMLGLPVGSGASGLETASLSKKGLSDFGVMDLNTHIPSYFQTVEIFVYILTPLYLEQVDIFCPLHHLLFIS